MFAERCVRHVYVCAVPMIIKPVYDCAYLCWTVMSWLLHLGHRSGLDALLHVQQHVCSELRNWCRPFVQTPAVCIVDCFMSPTLWINLVAPMLLQIWQCLCCTAAPYTKGVAVVLLCSLMCSECLLLNGSAPCRLQCPPDGVQ